LCRLEGEAEKPVEDVQDETTPQPVKDTELPNPDRDPFYRIILTGRSKERCQPSQGWQRYDHSPR